MCGLLGASFSKDCDLSGDAAQMLIANLMLANDSRGGDAIGLAIVSPELKSSFLFKDSGKIADLVSKRVWRNPMRKIAELRNKKVPFAVIGHNRKATHGAHTARNAHPFVFGQPRDDETGWIIGAHNGVLSRHEEFAKHWKLTSRKMEVDSEIIFRAIQAEVADVDTVFSWLGVEGSIAATYMIDLDNVKLVRVDRPLSIRSGNGMTAWSSEQKHVDSATIGINGLQNVQVDTHTKFSVCVTSNVVRKEGKLPIILADDLPKDLQAPTFNYTGWTGGSDYSKSPHSEYKSKDVKKNTKDIRVISSAPSATYKDVTKRTVIPTKAPEGWKDRKNDDVTAYAPGGSVLFRPPEEDGNYSFAYVSKHTSLSVLRLLRDLRARTWTANSSQERCWGCDTQYPAWQMHYFDDVAFCPSCYGDVILPSNDDTIREIN